MTLNMKGVIIIGLMAISSIWLYQRVNDLIKPLPKPELDTNTYWGPGNPTDYAAPKDVVPFKIEYDQTVCKNEKKKKMLNTIESCVNGDNV